MEDRGSRDLVLRLGRLQRSNGRQRVALVAGLAALGLAAASQTTVPSVRYRIFHLS